MNGAWVAKAADESPVIYGIVLAPDQVVSGQTLTPAAIEEAAHSWMLDASSVAKSAAGGRVTSSMVSPVDMTMTDDQGRGHPVPRGSWVLGVRADDPDLLRRARSGELSFAPIIMPDAPVGTAVTPRPITKQEAPTVSTTNQDAAYEEIKKAAVATQRPDETTAQAITRVASARPDLYQAYRDAEPSAPVAKSATQSAAERRIEERVAKEMSIDPSLTKEQALVRVTEGKEGRKLMAEYRTGREETLKAMNAIPYPRALL